MPRRKSRAIPPVLSTSSQKTLLKISLASLNNGRPPYRVRWQGCLRLKKGVQVDVVHSDDEGTEIVYQGKHWFADDPLF